MSKLKTTDIPKLLMLIRVNFENAYNFKTRDETKLLIDYWYNCLQDYPREVVYKAFDNAIKSSEFAPKLANVLAEADKLMSAGKKTYEELWSELCMVRDEAYNAFQYCSYRNDADTRQDGLQRLDELWNGLSEELKAFCVNKQGLAEIGGLDAEQLRYEKARFFKAVPRLRDTLETRKDCCRLLKLADAAVLGIELGDGDKDE